MATNLSRLFAGLRLTPVVRPCQTVRHTSSPAIVAHCTYRQQCILPVKCVGRGSKVSAVGGLLTRQLHQLSLNPTEKNRVLLHPTLPVMKIHRNKTKLGWTSGKPKTVKAVVRRFYRLDWGAWIRPRSGRRKHLWKKNKGRKVRLNQHVFCNAQQSKLLDKMVTSYWRRKKYYPDDPYEPYNKRTNFPLLPEKEKPFYP